MLKNCSDSPRADAALLLAYVLQRDRSWLVAHSDEQASAEDVRSFGALCERRGTGLPIAYLLGSAHFYGREFLVSEHVLIPRPETERLVEEGIAFIEARKAAGAVDLRVLDVGAGSGAIACTIAAETGLTVDATEISPSALEVAKGNAARLKIAERCRFWCGALTRPVGFQKFDLVIANLPYVATRDLPKPPEGASFEPESALNGGRDGLLHYRRLVRELPRVLKPGGLALLECAPPTAEKLAGLVRLALPNSAVSIGKDYAALDRYVKAIGKLGLP